MAKKLDPRLIEILSEYGEDPNEALWDCHGTWVVYHKAIERIAAKAGVTFDMPQIIEASSRDKIAAIAVRGTMKDRSEWSFGEAAPSNNKNAYPFAMAEKRAKDRVVLKLVGLHGLAYSEEESDDFKPGQQPSGEVVQMPAKSSAQLKRDVDWREVEREVWETKTLIQLEKVRKHYRELAIKEGWNHNFKYAIKELLDKQEQDIREWAEAEAEADARKADALKSHPIMAG